MTRMKKFIMFILVACFLPNRIYSQKTTTKVFDCGVGVRLDTEVYPSIPITFEIPSNYLEKYETDTNCFAYIYKSGEIICVYSDWTRRKSWSPGVHEVNEKQADEIICIVNGPYGFDVNESPWVYKNNRQSVIVSLGNSVCLLFNIKKKNTKKYTQIIESSFKELTKQ